MGDLILGVDFKARRERELESMAAEIMNVALMGDAELPGITDTNGISHFVSPDKDSA